MLSLAFERSGSGRPLVLLHSGLCDRSMWNPQVVVLGEQFEVFAVDLPGFGRSPDPELSYALGECLAGFVDSNIGHPVAMLGASYGAQAALELAAVRPDLAGPLVLSGTIAGLETPSAELLAIWRDSETAWLNGDKNLAIEIETRAWFDGSGRRPQEVDQSIRDYLVLQNRTIWERRAAVPIPEPIELSPPLLNRLPDVSSPVMIIEGELDLPDVRASHRKLVAALPNARVTVVPGTAHFPNLERPDVFNRIALGFLEEHWPPLRSG